MKYENIIKKLKTEGYEVMVGEFAYTPCLAVTGTCLVDVVVGEIKETEGRYKDVVQQIKDGRSHIQNIECVGGCKKKNLSYYPKWEG